MNRRDLLLLRTSAGQRVFELACERLWMRHVDARRSTGPITVPEDHWLGEPERQVEPTSTRDLFEALQRDLVGADVLRVVDERWLADAELRREVDALIAGFRESGGRVEFVAGAPAAPPPAGPDRPRVPIATRAGAVPAGPRVIA